MFPFPGSYSAESETKIARFSLSSHSLYHFFSARKISINRLLNCLNVSFSFFLRVFAPFFFLQAVKPLRLFSSAPYIFFLLSNTFIHFSNSLFTSLYHSQETKENNFPPNSSNAHQRIESISYYFPAEKSTKNSISNSRLPIIRYFLFSET